MLSDKQIRSLIKIQVSQQQIQSKTNKLDLSHQQLKKLKQINIASLDINQIDLSYNFFKNISSLNFKQFQNEQNLNIKWIDLSFNFISQIDSSFEASLLLKNVKYLNLTANRIQAIDLSDIELPILQNLILSNNKIKFFMYCPLNLKTLILDNNYLNCIGFDGGQSLNILSANNNKIIKINFKCPNLIVLDFQKNNISQLQLLEQCIKITSNLMSIDLRNNPITKNKKYKILVFQNCPNIGQIDNLIINPYIRQGFKILKSQQQLDQLINQVNKQYQKRLQQKQKIKKQLIKKIKQQQKDIQKKYQTDINREKDQFNIIQQQASKILGKRKLTIQDQMKQFSQLLQTKIQLKKDNKSMLSPSQEVHIQNLNQYLQYKKNIKPIIQSQETSSKSSLSSRNNQRQFQSNNSQANKVQKIQSNSKIDNKRIKGKQKINFKGISLFNPKCVDYLLKNYNLIQEQP